MKDNRVTRATYGFNHGRNSIGNDPNKFITKPFDFDMKFLSNYIHQFVYININKLGLHKKNHTINLITVLYLTITLILK